MPELSGVPICPGSYDYQAARKGAAPFPFDCLIGNIESPSQININNVETQPVTGNEYLLYQQVGDGQVTKSNVMRLDKIREDILELHFPRDKLS